MSDDAGTRVELAPGVSLPAGELEFQATRSGGPGGQHVNTSATRVELSWDIASSPSIGESVRARLLERLATRLHGQGVLRVVAADSRSQHRNRRAAVDRMSALVTEALKRRKKRRKTRPSKAAVERRIAAKKRRAEVKRRRRPPGPED